MKLRALVVAVFAALTVIPSAAHAAPAAADLKYRCTVGHVQQDANVVIAVATIDNRQAVDTAAGICGLLISTSEWQDADNTVNWEKNKNVVMVCGIPVGRNAAVAVFATWDDLSQEVALEWCDYLTFNGQYHAYYYP